MTYFSYTTTDTAGNIIIVTGTESSACVTQKQQP